MLIAAEWRRRLRAFAIIISCASLAASFLSSDSPLTPSTGQAAALPAGHMAQLIAREVAAFRSTRVPWVPDSALVETLRHDVAICGELRDTVGPVRWFRVGPKTTDMLAGLWLGPDTIILADTAPEVMRHELRHHLLRGDPRHAHPAWTRCD